MKTRRDFSLRDAKVKEVLLGVSVAQTHLSLGLFCEHRVDHLSEDVAEVLYLRTLMTHNSYIKVGEREHK